MRIYRFLISGILSLCCSIGYGQADSILQDSTWLKKRFLPTGVRVGTDLISIIGPRTTNVGAGESINQFKFSADIDFYRYFLNLEFGTSDREWFYPSDNSVYSNKGTYFKIGTDVNFLYRDPDQSALFFGLRYSIATFDDQLTYIYTNGFWGDNVISFQGNGSTYQWLELTMGLKVKLYKIIWSGYTARLKFGGNASNDNQSLAPFWVPGYGRAAELSRWGFEYWIIIRIPFRKYIPAPKKKD